MKNLLFGILTLAVLFGISSIAVSPELTDFFVDEESREQLKAQREDLMKASTSSLTSPEKILKQTGQEWQILSDRQRLEFVLHLSKGMQSRNIEIQEPNKLLEQIDRYYEDNPKEVTIEQAIMDIVAESALSD